MKENEKLFDEEMKDLEDLLHLQEDLDIGPIYSRRLKKPLPTKELNNLVIQYQLERSKIKKIDIQNKIIDHNLKMVIQNAQRWIKGRIPLDLDPLIQIGIMRGLLKAANDYSIKRGASFATVARKYIKTAITDFARQELKKREKEDQPEGEIGDEGDIVNKIDQAIAQRTYVPWITSPAGEEQITAKIFISKILKKLPKRESDIVKMKELEGMTLDEIHRKLNISIERVRQIHFRAMKSLRGLAKR